ncbi:MAG: hypothetical protein HY553_10410, partial [Elusimicrobia bacterium]|nr:hypothetical protein [Elusimicrobiota bacterium]
VSAMASASFDARYGTGAPAWREDRATAAALAAAVLAARPGAKALAEHRAELLRRSEPADVMDGVQAVTVAIMKLNGALKVRDHLWRLH